MSRFVIYFILVGFFKSHLCHCILQLLTPDFLKTVFQCAVVSPLPGCHGRQLHMSSTMWYIMQSIQSKYSLSERLIRTIAAIRSFPHDNVEDLIRKVGLIFLSNLKEIQFLSVICHIDIIVSFMPQGADVNRMHGTLKPLHCACMVADADCVELLLEKGAEVRH